MKQWPEALMSSSRHREACHHSKDQIRGGGGTGKQPGEGELEEVSLSAATHLLP